MIGSNRRTKVIKFREAKSRRIKNLELITIKLDCSTSIVRNSKNKSNRRRSKIGSSMSKS